MNELLSISLILALVVVLSTLELFYPQVRFEKREHWWKRVAFLQFIILIVVSLSASSWQEKLLNYRLWQGSKAVTPFWGGVVGYGVSTFVFYWWHRARHNFSLLWRGLHQLHHSPSRIQTVTAFYVHPLEASAGALINAFIVYFILGFEKESLIWVGFFTALAGIFYHMNLRTPHWIGYFIQRPEMHKVHHELNVHAYNYSDLPIWDLLFKTYSNPITFTGTCGFAGKREYQFKEILFHFKDVN